MSVKPEDFLNSSKCYIDISDDEIHFRNATSRAYYSSFHYAYISAHHLKLAVPVYAAGSHDRIFNELRICKNSDGRKIGNLGKRLKDIRKHADYEINKDFHPGKATNAISLSEAIKSHAEKILTTCK